MGKRARSHIEQSASRRPAVPLIIASRSEDALGLILRRAFRRARLVPDLNAPDIQKNDLAVGIFEGGDNHSPHELAACAQAAGVSLLVVQLREKETLIGPLTIPGRAGCERCAY